LCKVDVICLLTLAGGIGNSYRLKWGLGIIDQL
jgi:hypothetical protein